MSHPVPTQEYYCQDCLEIIEEKHKCKEKNE